MRAREYRVKKEREISLLPLQSKIETTQTNWNFMSWHSRDKNLFADWTEKIKTRYILEKNALTKWTMNSLQSGSGEEE